MRGTLSARVHPGLAGESYIRVPPIGETAGEAWRQVRARIIADLRQFIAYVLLRLVLPTIAMVAVFIVLIIPGLAVAASLGAMEYGIHSAFANATGGAAAAGIAIQIFFGVVAFFYAVLASICLGGPLSTGTREYALIFYGGRYAALGNILYPPPALPPDETGTPRFA